MGEQEESGLVMKADVNSPGTVSVPPTKLRPVEQEAWLAMAQSNGASNHAVFNAFFPASYRDPFMVESDGVRVVLQTFGSAGAITEVAKGQVIYRDAYRETGSLHTAKAGRSDEFLLLHTAEAPRRFEYEIIEVTGARRTGSGEGAVL